MSALTKITRRAKAIRKAHKSKAWTDCVKQASREYNSGRLGATLTIEKGESRRTKPKKVVRVTRKANGTYKKTETIGGAKSFIRSYWKEKLKEALFLKAMAGNKTDRRKAGKKVTEAKRNVKMFN